MSGFKYLTSITREWVSQIDFLEVVNQLAETEDDIAEDSLEVTSDTSCHLMQKH